MSKKVTGIGGVFFKCNDPAKIKEWYKSHLGIDAGKWGATFEFHPINEPKKKAVLAWNPFKKETKHFEPSQKEFMINYRVENLEELVKELKNAGVTVCDEIASYDYGKFVHVLDPENNKIELWEPVDDVL